MKLHYTNYRICLCHTEETFKGLGVLKLKLQLLGLLKIYTFVLPFLSDTFLKCLNFISKSFINKSERRSLI